MEPYLRDEDAMREAQASKIGRRQIPADKHIAKASLTLQRMPPAQAKTPAAIPPELLADLNAKSVFKGHATLFLALNGSSVNNSSS
ncbi:hypothetical protein QTH87_25280 [Variovorax sp. J22P168]|uniref:hypothetical protein n=1 Tax=Variovorax jilinensis TaxID=3053513 RepID=UPI00257828EB|nr:hypothetical protein [Variovorax sp. J22P168]MDM0015776.1 hypothetical protein [Variovorax sp. J22P168]